MTKGPSVSVPTILLVEDEEDLANEIKAELEGDGYLVRRLSIADAADAAAMSDAAMLILDRIHHGIDSLHTVQIIRKQGAKIPVLIISACSSADDVAEGLRAGADDYLPKPFYMVELVARVEAMLRRLGDISTTRLIVGDLEIDLLEGTAFKASAKLNLLPREFKLLEYFARRPGQLITRAMLLKDVWQYDFEVETNVVDTHISNLRKKIDEHGLPSRIANVRGLGYMLRPHAA
ncbi:response regulator transcription factor [Bradyrhizobium sp.]|uniref:response regulator transcription factor n=1 Tax=Bradyrhizobium sp. TaxID=376 RepID=UPI0023A4FE90|nr:response regulator transcription factor [Bradyrhizobium sp.]MDE1934256.1 response regulator transcription factor [Bradyrhizobium sp.]